MKKIDEALEKLSRNTEFNESYADELKNTIKQGIIDRDNRIKVLEHITRTEYKQALDKLNAIEKVIPDDTKAGTGDECRLKAYYKIKDILNDN